MGKWIKQSLQAEATKILIKIESRSEGHSTKRDRTAIVKAEFKQLGKMFKGLKLENLRERHVQRLVDHWKNKNIDSRTMKNRMSAIRHIAVAKNIILPKLNKDFGIENDKKDCNTDKSWVPSDELLNEMTEEQRLHVELMSCFGMRFEEAAKFQIEKSDLRGISDENLGHVRDQLKGKAKDFFPKGDKVFIQFGCKNGRKRVNPIKNDKQRDLLNRVRIHCENAQKLSLMPEHLNYRKWKEHAEYIYKGYGMTKEDVGSCHGLRHDFMQKAYTEISNWKSPCKLSQAERIEFKSNMSKDDKETDRKARWEVSCLGGHSRIGISKDYVGSWS